jgi:tetratricopeptide (TPR) repeat protein
VKLWRVSRDAGIVKRELRLTYARTLGMVADLFYARADDPYEATLVLRRAYEFAAGEEQGDVSKPSLCESAAYRLGRYFEEAKCHQSALFWFKRSLTFARLRPVDEYLLVNLRVAWNLEPLQWYEEARPHYDEILTLLWPTDRSLLLDRLRHLMPAAMYTFITVIRSSGGGHAETQSLLSSDSQDLPSYFAAGLCGLQLYLAQHRRDDAVKLARLMMAHVKRFGEVADELRNQMHGLIAAQSA